MIWLLALAITLVIWLLGGVIKAILWAIIALIMGPYPYGRHNCDYDPDEWWLQ